MSIFNYFFRKEKSSSATIAKERLQIVVAHQRRKRDEPDYLPLLQQEILQVIRKYVQNIDENQVSVELDSSDDRAVLELNITLPDR